MAHLIGNSIIKFAILGMLYGSFELARAVLVTSGGNGSDPVHGGGEFFRMINDFDRVSEQGSRGPSGAFTLSSNRRSVAECGGVYKRLQSEIRSPGFPDGYQGGLHCEYTFKSPFVCSNQYHFQFVEFALEPSRDCAKDRLAIGDDEVLCGTVIGSKLYDAPGGLLRMKFVTDTWGTGRGFRILVTRQPCTDDNEAAESSTAYTVFTTIQVEDGTDSSGEDTSTDVPAVVPGRDRVVSSRQDIPAEFNPGGNGYLPPVTVAPPTYPQPTYPSQTFPCPAPCPYPWGCPNYPYMPVLPPRPSCDPTYQSCSPTNPAYPPPRYPTYPQQPVPLCPTTPGCVPGSSYPQYPQYPPYFPNTPGTEGTTSLGGPPPGYEPAKTEVKPEFPEPTTDRGPEVADPENQVAYVPGQALPRCCRNAFNQRRFYLSSANFPSEATVNQDCVVQIQRFSPYTCRLVIAFKFFALGNPQLPGCPGGFLEVDGQRICGCRTGQVYRTVDFGPFPTKTVRIHSRAGRFPTVQGFLLDIYQEECQGRVPLKRSDSYAAAPSKGYGYEMYRADGRELTVPLRTVETTNTTTTQRQTTHRFYYYNMDDAKPIVRPQDARGESQKFVQLPPLTGGATSQCVFSSLDWLRLKLDWLWIFKPVCFA